MDVLIYNELDPQQIDGFDKLLTHLRNDDFKSADVKKIQDNLYRAKLNRSDRILFSIYAYQQKKYILILEYLKRHDYQGSRFLKGLTTIQEEDIPAVEHIDTLNEHQRLVYINPNNPRFVYLNKFISFDDVQEHIYRQEPPLMIIGSAGSGKTAILLEKMKTLTGKILYVTLSSFLVKHSKELYFSQDYYSTEQDVDFYSYDEFLESIAVPTTQQAEFKHFSLWYREHDAAKKYPIQSLYEEFKGVLTGTFTTQAYLTETQYLGLGIKQSIFSGLERVEIYPLFLRYRCYLAEQGLHDNNILSFEYLDHVMGVYDYVVIDEVQDITAIQLYLVLNSLKQRGQFLLCGDANQIVHPNFFSWAKVKTLFFNHEHLHDGLEITHILHHNYRNAQRVTEISNRVLLLKNARFGSIDKESHYLVDSHADLQGGVFFLKDAPKVIAELDKNTAISTQFAVIVMHDEQKKAAQRVFKTPLVFSIQEAKGLEYKNIILYNFVSHAQPHFDEICRDIRVQDLQADFKYARNKDKADKSLEVYKFYINALYVGLTRAMHQLYWVERAPEHQLFHLLGLEQATDHLHLEEQQSSLKEWQKEAQRLALQGKTEQAERIRKEILKEETPTWAVLQGSILKRIEQLALVEGNKKAKLQLFEYAVVYSHQAYLSLLAQSGFKPAQHAFGMMRELKVDQAQHAVANKYFMDYQIKNPTGLMKKIEKFGINYLNEFAQTPIMAAVVFGQGELFEKLCFDGADLHLTNALQQNILQVALSKAAHSAKYTSTFLSRYTHLFPLESLVLQLDQKLFKLEWQHPAYFIFNLIYANFFTKNYRDFVIRDRLITSEMLMKDVRFFPPQWLPFHRQERSYLSALLSKHEVDSQDPYNKKLFKRVKRGSYILNPDLVIKVQGEWKKIYSAMGFDRIDFYPRHDEDNVLLRKINGIVNQNEHLQAQTFFKLVGHPDADREQIEPVVE